MKLKLMTGISTVIAVLALMTPLASAHVVVTPATAAPAERVLFTVSVPNEKSMPMTGLRVSLPAGVKDVMPTVHPGWTIAVSTEGSATGISWTGGELPTGQRDDFSFRVQVPSKTGELQWKAYQTYADGTTVAWDQAPTSKEGEGEGAGPYSVTKVLEAAPEKPVAKTSGTATAALGISLAALLLGVANLVRKRSAK